MHHTTGIYEKLITELFNDKLTAISQQFYIQNEPLEKADAARGRSSPRTEHL